MKNVNIVINVKIVHKFMIPNIVLIVMNAKIYFIVIIYFKKDKIFLIYNFLLEILILLLV